MRVFNDLSELLDEAAAGPDIRKYLHLRGVKTIGTFALIAKDEESLSRCIIEPLLAGWGSGGDAITVQRDEHPIVTAVLLHAWTLARTSWTKTLAMAAPSAVSATPPATGGSGGSTAATTSDLKVPKTLPAGKWSELVQAYNSVTVRGKPRSFPVREVLGAESVIARLWHERHISHLYSPLQLGEILQVRSFTASGDINPLLRGAKRHTALTLDDDRQLVETEDQTWSPRSVLSVLDGINAAKWALTLTQWGDEEDVATFCEFMQQRARARHDKMEQFVSYWHAAMWKVAMAMRGGETFSAATQPVMADMETYHDYMNKEINTLRSKTKQPPKVDSPDKNYGKAGKGGKVGKGSKSNSIRTQPYQRQRWNYDDGSRWDNYRGGHESYGRWRNDSWQQHSWGDRFSK